MILAVRSGFSSAHLYHQPLWDEKTNKEVFGRCFTEHGHGHNYTLEVGFKSSIASVEKDQEYYQELVKKLTSILDHEHLNHVIPEFKKTIPTTENIALYFQSKLEQEVAKDQISYIKLFELDNLWTEIRL